MWKYNNRLSDHDLEQLVEPLEGKTRIMDYLSSLEVRSQISLSDGKIRIAKIDSGPSIEISKYPSEDLAKWPFPADSQLDTMPFRPQGSIAVLAPGPVFQIIKLLKYAYQHGGDAVGTCRSNTLGVERIVGNLVGNPNYRYLFMIGPHGVHRPERALLNLHRYGVDERGNIKAPDPWCPCLEILSKQVNANDILERFRKQITIVDLVDEEFSMPALAFLLSLCHQGAVFKAEIKGQEYVFTTRGAYKEDEIAVEPLIFRPEELAKIDTVSAGSFALTALVDVSPSVAYRMALGCVLEYGKPLIEGQGAKGLHVRNFGISVIDVSRKHISIPNILRGLGIVSKIEQVKYLDAYSFWTYLVPFSTVLWDAGKGRPVLQVDEVAESYGTRLFFRNIGNLSENGRKAILNSVEEFQQLHNDALPNVSETMRFYKHIRQILEDIQAIGQVEQMIIRIRGDVESGELRRKYTMVVDENHSYSLYTVQENGRLASLGGLFEKEDENSLNWFPRVYGGIRLGQFFAEALGVRLESYVHRTEFFLMSQSEVDWFKR